MPEACNFIEKETLTQVFSCEFCKISKNTFFTEHLWAIASVLPQTPKTMSLATMVNGYVESTWFLSKQSIKSQGHFMFLFISANLGPSSFIKITCEFSRVC